ncbi:hypothetical protein QNA08_02435 [Chelatococcus sp. SYSU_G07232]|uniref:O-antigen ligase domain-containing protein n=1 Tax=Chelatococcus albus TaxID=3047466 RepID=A0ABT7ACJ2_9HYPH|nr:hypothetical protein [Chelatococcus sp. SYSU_G07232]MDJ1157095.1 hypothetical protein [Chelatococcus sp. SYSU_G07232]
MQVSVAGILIGACLLLLSRQFGAPHLVALVASLAFGSTAIVTLNALGGSTPLVYTPFAMLLALAVALRRDALHELSRLFARQRVAWVIVGLTAYAFIGAYILPRLFAGQTSAFVPSRALERVLEVPLAPVSGNISQTGYFALGAVTFLALGICLRGEGALDAVRRGFLLWATLHVGMGVLDLAGKMVGMGDVLLPIRSAGYAFMTDRAAEGFWRIVGGYSEASAFAAASLACLAFVFTYWRATGSRIALFLTLATLTLLILSTSSTAYVGGAAVAVPVVASIVRSALVGRLSHRDLQVIGVLTLAIAGILAVYLYNERLFEPFLRLLETMVVDKAASGSGRERIYWNQRSIQSFLDTGGLGIGFGSSRASSWPVAVLSQLGFIGSLMVVTLLAVLCRRIQRPVAASVDPAVVALHDSVRACALVTLLAATISGGSADPGLLFFIALAVVLACREKVRREGIARRDLARLDRARSDLTGLSRA